MLLQIVKPDAERGLSAVVSATARLAADIAVCRRGLSPCRKSNHRNNQAENGLRPKCSACRRMVILGVRAMVALGVRAAQAGIAFDQ